MKALLSCLAALPLVAHGQEQSEPLFLEYEGVVTAVDAAPWWSYRPGDQVKGLVKIYPDLAPPPVIVGAQSLAEYSRGSPGPDWVVSNRVQGSRHGDAALLLNDTPDDIYRVDDAIFDGRNAPHRFEIVVEREGLNVDLGLVQSFDAIPARDGSKAMATLEGYLDGIGRAVQMALTRVSLTPGMCRPH